ncbi:MFS transporter [Sinomonas sp. R1AF57]|uniref:MFS transporter n=1 Tax=Sinomonas sp. R1AF57 TaxID=2020377 RepID=UPI000B6131D1|nr:MFS transporter [Sinomonas sp. R1AF57]ASN51885.1 MFS transporter [Sinomonas sp. R1AF57]
MPEPERGAQASAATTGRLTHDDAARRRVQRRTVGVLAAAQLLSGLGNGATLAIGSLLAVDFGGSAAWAGSVTTVLTLAAALAALPLSGFAASRGRRKALVTGLGIAALGSGSVVLATMASSLILLLAGAALLGVGTAVNLQSRFAAVDLADAAHRGRDLSLVVWSITVGAVAGPNLIKPGAALGAALGLPETAGPFVISVTGMAVAAALLWTRLRPDPLLEARRISGDAAEPAGSKRPRGAVLRAGIGTIRSSPGAGLAVSAVVSAHGIMVAVMSMTPLHLQQVTVGGVADGGGHVGTDSFALIGFVISLHIAGMYALSPLMGWLADRVGRRTVLAAGHVTLLGAVATAALGAASPASVTVALVLLGLGWSAATIAGSALLAEAVAPNHRVEAQGVGDTAMGLAGALGGGLSGIVMALIGFPGLAAVAGLISVAVLAVAAVGRRAYRS